MQIRLAVVLYTILDFFKKGSTVYTVACVVICRLLSVFFVLVSVCRYSRAVISNILI